MIARAERVPRPRAEASALGDALRAGRPPAIGLLPAIPGSASAWRSAAARVSTPPAGLGARLAGRQGELGASARAADNARALDEPGTLAVVAGQQPGLLGGPLLTLHKAAGVLSLAARLEALLARRVVPLFWSAADDHDMGEMCAVWVVDRRGQPRRLAEAAGVTAAFAGDRVSASDRPVPPEVERSLLAFVASMLPDTARAREVVGRIPPAGATDFATWSARCLLALLGDTGLVVVEPSVLAPFASDLYCRLLEGTRDGGRSLAAAGAELEAAGFPAPLARREGEAFLFLRDRTGGARRRVVVDADGTVRFRDEPATGRPMAEVARAIREQPHLASADVAGRVVLQDALLPVVAFLAGPTELAYLAQCRPLHDLAGVPFPVVVPRPEALWLDGETARAAEAFRLSPAEVTAGARPAAADVAASSARWARLETALRPGARPQERVLSPLSLAARHGIEAIRSGLSHLDPLEPGTLLLHLGEDGPEAA